MSAELGELDLLRDLARRLAEAPHGGKTALVDAAAKVLCCSRQEVYRRLKCLVGYTTGRKRRKDRGKCSVSAEAAQQAATFVKTAMRKNGKKTMPLTVVNDLLAANEAEVNVSPATLARAMRRYGCHPAQLVAGRPSTQQRSQYPNHVWQVDASLCVLFYLPRSGLRVASEAEFYKNKPQNLARIEKERVWRYVISDHYSGAIYVKYIQTAGETAQALIEVFMEAIQDRGRHDPLHGVPAILFMDAGSANTSHLFLNLLDRLNVRHITHIPGNPRAKGQVESMQNVVETQFEGRLAFHRVGTIQELQEAADRWRVHYNAHAILGRHGKPRNDVWMTITEDQLRLAPSIELCRELVTTKPVQVSVKPDMTISHAVKGHGRHDYDVRYLPGLTPRCKVQVVVNPYRAPAVDVILVDDRGDESVWTVEPVVRDEAGFRMDAPVIGQEFQALPETVADKHVKAIEEVAAHGRQTGETPYSMDVFADLKDAPTYIPKRGRDLGLDAARREVAPLTITEAAMRLKKQLGSSWTADRYEWLRQRYPDGVPADQMETVANLLATPAAAKATPLRVMGGAS